MEDEFANLDLTMERIKSLTKHALAPGADHELVYSLWRKEFFNRVSKPKPNILPLIYSCNDILQESAKVPEANAAYTRLFSPTAPGGLRDVLAQALEARPDEAKRIEKVIGIWRERRVFSSDQVGLLKKFLFSKNEAEKTVAGGYGDEDNYGDSDAEDVQEEEGRNKEQWGRDASNEREEEEAPKEDAHELQSKRLRQMPHAQLFALMHTIDAELKESVVEDADAAAGGSDKLERQCDALDASSSSVKSVEYAIEDVKKRLEELKKQRFALQAKAPVQLAVKLALEKSIQQVEEDMHRTEQNLDQTRAVTKVLDEILAKDQFVPASGVLEGKYKSVKWMPKREQQVQQLVSVGPDLNYDETFEGVTAEDAAKSTRPMMWHRGLQRYVPMPSGDDADNWRN